MPRIIGQGQGDATEAKVRGLGSAFAINVGIFKARFSEERFRNAVYFHFDLNSGGGVNEEVGCIGSPLAFLHAARRVGETRYYATFVDQDDVAVKKLLAQKEVYDDDRCFVHHGDNRELIDAIPDIIKQRGERPQFAIGTILCDPNGAEVPVAKLAKLAITCPRLDVFVNWNSAAYKRSQGRLGNLMDSIESMNKGHWQIRAPLDKWQWTLLLGRNVHVNDHRAQGFHHLNSPSGQEILARCHFTKDQREEQARREQGELFKA